MDRLAVSLDAFRRGFQQGVMVGGGAQAPPVATDPVVSENSTDPAQEQIDPAPTNRPNGLPKENVSFLLPYDRSSFDEDKLAGEYRGFASEPTTLNTVVTSMGATSAIVNMVSDSLCVTYPQNPSAWHQGLATDVIISDNFKRFVFTIREGVFWHVPTMASEPGREWMQKEVELTAHDFVFFIEMVNNTEVNAPHLRAYYANATARAIDDYTFELIWSESQYTNIQFSLNISHGC